MGTTSSRWLCRLGLDFQRSFASAAFAAAARPSTGSSSSSLEGVKAARPLPTSAIDSIHEHHCVRPDSAPPLGRFLARAAHRRSFRIADAANGRAFLRTAVSRTVVGQGPVRALSRRPSTSRCDRSLRELRPNPIRIGHLLSSTRGRSRRERRDHPDQRPVFAQTEQLSAFAVLPPHDPRGCRGD